MTVAANPAFAAPVSVRFYSYRGPWLGRSGGSKAGAVRRSARPSLPCRKRRRVNLPLTSVMRAEDIRGGEKGEEVGVEGESESIFLDEEEGGFWRDLQVSQAPLTKAEEEELLERLPGPIARFMIRRARGSEGRDEKRKRFSEGFEEQQEPEFADEEYLYNPDWGERLRPHSEDADDVWDPDDGIDVEDVESEGKKDAIQERKRTSLFMGPSEEEVQQAEDVGLAVVGVLVLFVVIKLAISFLTFFLSFTFSFLAIFALSAGIFVFFYLLNF